MIYIFYNNYKMLKFLKIIILFIHFNPYLSYMYPICAIIYYKKNGILSIRNNNIDLKPQNITPKLLDNRICPICKLKINIKSNIPENCSIPIGCPYNIKTKYNNIDTFKG